MSEYDDLPDVDEFKKQPFGNPCSEVMLTEYEMCNLNSKRVVSSPFQLESFTEDCVVFNL